METGARVRVIDWNLDGFTGIAAKVDLLSRFDWDVLLLQEITASSWDALCSLGTSATWSQPHVPVLTQAPRYHSAIVCRNGWRLAELGSISGLPSPERVVVAQVERDGVACVMVSAAVPPGVSWGDAGKGRQADVLASWLSTRRLPTVVGIDANTPKTDRLWLEECEWWNEQEPLLLGAERVHDLRDAYRDVLASGGELRADVDERQPDGPLAVSHVRGRGARAVECRYDHILVSPEIEVADMDYVWGEAVAAGSDHALLIAELEVPST